LRIHILAAPANVLGDALEATPFSNELKELLWSELTDSVRFPIGPNSVLKCASVTAPVALDDISGFSEGDGVACLDMGLRANCSPPHCGHLAVVLSSRNRLILILLDCRNI